MGKKKDSGWYYFFRDPYFLYLKEFLFLDIWIIKPISIVIFL